MIRNSTKVLNEIKNLLDDALKFLWSKEDIDSVKTIKELELKITK